MKIGFFDSGLGGLIILQAVTKVLPAYDYYYYGDTANLPLGDKTKDEIFEFTRMGVEYLFEHDCQLVIVACNTSSADSVKELQLACESGQYEDKKVLGVIIPTVEEIIGSKHKNVLLIGTKHTIASNKYRAELLSRIEENVILESVATPELVPMIEAGHYQEATEKAIEYIEAEGGESSLVVLGCTHYTKIKKPLRLYFDGKKEILSQDEIIPLKLKEYLGHHLEIKNNLSQEGKRDIFLTEHRADYDSILENFLGSTS